MVPDESARFEQRSLTTLDRLTTSTHTLLCATRPIGVFINPAHSMKGTQVVREDYAPRAICTRERALYERASQHLMRHSLTGKASEHIARQVTAMVFTRPSSSRSTARSDRVKAIDTTSTKPCLSLIFLLR
jgi:molecular chaperone DnaK (HSP70)